MISSIFVSSQYTLLMNPLLVPLILLLPAVIILNHRRIFLVMQSRWLLDHFFLFCISEIINGFRCSRCLNDHIKVPEMMRLFAGGATTPLVVKIWTKQPWVKIENSCNFDCNFVLSRGKIWLLLFYNFICVIFLKFYIKNFKSFRAKMKVWHWFLRFKIKSKFGKIAVMPSFLLEMTWNF